MIISEMWEWMVAFVTDRSEYYSKWYQEHKENVKGRNLEAVRRYQEKKINEDPDGYLEKKREVGKKASKKYYAKKRSEMTPEEIEERRRITREKMREIRARRKLEHEQAQQNGPA